MYILYTVEDYDGSRLNISNARNKIITSWGGVHTEIQWLEWLETSSSSPGATSPTNILMKTPKNKRGNTHTQKKTYPLAI